MHPRIQTSKVQGDVFGNILEHGICGFPEIRGTVLEGSQLHKIYRIVGSSLESPYSGNHQASGCGSRNGDAAS